METITIKVQGEEFECLNVELTAEEVSALYKLRKENAEAISGLEKKLAESATSKKYTDEQLSSARDELSHAHTLMTALGVQEKTSEEEVYYRKALPVATRIALYIATKKTTG